MPAGGVMVHQSQGSLDTMPMPTEQLGYSGQISRCAGSACPDVFHAPPFAAVGPDIHGNVVCIIPQSRVLVPVSSHGALFKINASSALQEMHLHRLLLVLVGGETS